MVAKLRCLSNDFGGEELARSLAMWAVLCAKRPKRIGDLIREMIYINEPDIQGRGVKEWLMIR